MKPQEEHNEAEKGKRNMEKLFDLQVFAQENTQTTGGLSAEMKTYYGMELLDKLAILTDAAKYDAACTSSGVRRSARPGMIGNTTSSIAGCCHSFSADGRCVTLLKVLMTNRCVYDCKYCVNRRSNEAKRAMFTPEELADLTIQFYRRNYIEGLFLSSGVLRSPDYTLSLIHI